MFFNIFQVFKTGVTHYFSNEKAKRDLDYEPTIQNDMSAVVQWFKDHGHGRKTDIIRTSGSTLKNILMDLTMAAVFAAIVMSFIPTVK